MVTYLTLLLNPAVRNSKLTLSIKKVILRLFFLPLIIQSIAVRDNDQLKYYSNTNRWETLYDQKLSKNVEPKDYVNPLRVTKTQVEKPLLATAGKLSTLNNTTLKRTYGPAEPVDAFDEKNKGLQLFNQTVSSLKRDKDELNQSQRHGRASSYQPLHKSGQLPQQPLDDYGTKIF